MAAASRNGRLLTISMISVACLALCASPSASAAQYFGQNKVRYESLTFEVLKTAHFDIYHYEEERTAAEEVGRMAERWYARFSHILAHDLASRQPIILYASATAFRGTTAISGYIGETTGGVTEGLRRRLVMPLAGPMAESDHVLGHELVHAFQFDIAAGASGAEDGPAAGALQLPLWFVEGMAEYLSLGPVDAQTAMWLRDAVLREKVPSIQKLDDPRYFPYRYGHAFWAFIGGTYGDEMIGRILKRAAGGNAEAAISSTLGISMEDLSKAWIQELTDAYEPILKRTNGPDSVGRRIIGSFQDESGAGLNVAPVLSPDGRRMIFFSAKDLFSVDLFLADAETGRILDKITQTATDPHFDSLGFVASAGAWNNDGARFAFAGVSDGRPELDVYNPTTRKVERRTKLRSLGEILNLTWSPDGRRIAISAICNGVTDLFVFDVETETARRLTNDDYADLQPAWSPDGHRIAFVTDRFAADEARLQFGEYGLALLNPDSGEIIPIRAFDRAEHVRHINPQWSENGESLYFISDPDGIPNIYSVKVDGKGSIRQLTNLQTGVSGITPLSPAFSAAGRTNALVFTAFGNGNYVIYRMEDAATAPDGAPNAASQTNAATLPPAARRGNEVSSLLGDPEFGLPASSAFRTTAYRPRLALDGIAAPEIGVGVGSFGSFISGGTAIQWSDLLGYHNVAAVVQTANASGGFLNSMAAAGIYENQRSRWNWGVIVGQVPLMTVGFSQTTASAGGRPILIGQSIRFWQIDRELLGAFSYPFDRARRIEFSGGFQNISFNAQAQTRILSLDSGNLISDETENLPAAAPLRMAKTSAAYVKDASIFGGTSPIAGERYRVEYGVSAGTLTYSTALVDYRRYFQFARRLTLSGRLLHYGRYGGGAEDARQEDLFLGYPALVRGYASDSFTVDECGPEINVTGACPPFDRLLGSRLAVANGELRLPVFGLLGVIPSRSAPPVEAALFYDAGLAWRSERASIGGARKPVTSFGGSLRFNLLGFAVAQLSYVHPNSRPVKNWRWEFGFIPGF